MDKAELLETIRRERAEFDALVASLTDEQLIDTSLDGGRSVKDVLAHISLWERLCTSWLDDVAEGKTPARPEVRDVDGTNEREYLRAKTLPPEEVRAESRRTYAAIVSSIEALSDADLADETRFGWPTARMASSNTDEHYREHIDQIAAWLARSGGGGR